MSGDGSVQSTSVQDKPKKPIVKKWWLWAAAVVVAIGLLSGCANDEAPVVEESGPAAETVAEPDAPAPEPEITVVYEVVQEKPIPAGGTSRIILIDPQDSTEPRLRILGDLLHEEAMEADTNAAVFVFDNNRAADMHEDALADVLSESDLAFHDQHMVGTYRRNVSTGFQRFTGYPEGLGGPELSVDY